MQIIKPEVSLLDSINGSEVLRKIELYGRTCYKSIPKEGTSGKFVANAIKRGHFSIIEHEKITARIICDRGVTHELVRHRIASYSQESTRYVNYKEGITVIEPLFWPDDKSKPMDFKYMLWKHGCEEAEKYYMELIKAGAKPEEARTVLPNSLKTEIIVTFNLREWRHFFYLRGSRGAHPQIREIAVMLLDKIKEKLPVVFDDFAIDRENLLITTKILPAS